MSWLPFIPVHSVPQAGTPHILPCWRPLASVSYALNVVLQWHGMWAQSRVRSRNWGVFRGGGQSPLLSSCPKGTAAVCEVPGCWSPEHTDESSRGAAVPRAVLTVEHLATVLSLVNFSCFTLYAARPFATSAGATQYSFPEFWSQLSLRQC